MRRLIPTVVVVMLSLPACGGDDAGSAVPDSSRDPYGLAELAMPGDEAAILGVFASLPQEISGLPRTPGEDFELVVLYGALNTIVAIPFPGEEESLAEDLSRFEFEDGAVVEGANLDPAAGLLWLAGSFTDQGGAGEVHLVVWGEPDGAWAFNVSAETPETRDALVRAFVEAVRASG